MQGPMSQIHGKTAKCPLGPQAQMGDKAFLWSKVQMLAVCAKSSTHSFPLPDIYSLRFWAVDGATLLECTLHTQPQLSHTCLLFLHPLITLVRFSRSSLSGCGTHI